MAQIRKAQSHDDGLLQPAGLVLVSDMLYEKVRQRIEKKLSKELKRLTAQYLMDIYRRHAEGGMCIVMHHEMITMAMFKREPQLALGVFDIEPPYVVARLRFPLSGEAFRINEFLLEIIREQELERRVEVAGGELEIKIQLIEGDEPIRDPRDNVDRYGRRSYCCAREAKQIEHNKWFEEECAKRRL
jgi:hypothetical protein